MKEEYVPDLLDSLKAAGIDFAVGLPDSWLRNVIEALQLDRHFQYVPVCNEGVGFGICAGAWLGGRKPALFMENSGLRSSAEAIARINLHAGGGGGNHGVATLIVTSYRGDIGDTEFWAMPHGITCEPMLRALGVRYLIVRDARDLRKSILRAARATFTFLNPVAVLVSGDLTMED